jgi:hypothetical protein
MTTVENYSRGMVKDSIWMKRIDEEETIIAPKEQLLTGRNREWRKTQNKDMDEKDAWKTIPPKDGESVKKVIKIKGKKHTYYWCLHHHNYKMHKPQECCLKDEKKKGEQEKNKGVNNDSKNDANKRDS